MAERICAASWYSARLRATVFSKASKSGSRVQVLQALVNFCQLLRHSSGFVGATATFLSDLRLESLEELPPLTELGELVLPDLMETPPTGDEEAEEAVESGSRLIN